MRLLNGNYLRFDKEDVELMQTMMKQFHDMHQGTGMPDYSGMYVAYLPVFAIALLAAQESVGRLTRKLVCLTYVIALFTVVLTGLTIVLLVRA